MDATTYRATGTYPFSEADSDRAAMPEPGSPGFNAWVTAEAARMRQGDEDAAALHAMTRPAPFYCSPSGGCLCGCVACRDGWDEMICTCLTPAEFLGHGGRVAALYGSPATLRDLEHAGSASEVEAIIFEAVELRGFESFEGAPADAEYENVDRHQAAIDASVAWHEMPYRRGPLWAQSGA